MSKLDELIREFCPDGVPFQKVKEVYTRIKGTPITAGKMKEIACDDGEIRVFAGGKTVINAHEEDIPNANITRVPAVLVQSRGVIDAVYYDKPFTFKNEMWAYTTEQTTSVKFLYYVLKNNIQQFRDSASGMGALPQISLPTTEEFLMPVPPLPVQKEIVRILDSFTALTAELTAELTARKKQYDYYKSVVLSKADGGNAYLLNNICQIVDCPHTSPKWQESGIPVIRNFNLSNGTIDTRNLSYVSEEEYQQRVKRIIPQENDILFSREAPIGNVGLIPKGFRCCQGQRVVLLRPDTAVVSPKYLIHFLQSNLVKDQIAKKEGVGATVSNFNIADLRKLSVLVPSMEIQQKIVDILDVFEKYAMVVSAELPKEIELRKQQYEYYRDKLLSFKEFRNE